MRIALHTGKGGVGKTTVSALTGLAAAALGARTLLLSTDPAHSVADVLDCPVGADPTPVPGVDGLFAAQVDTMARYEQAWSSIRRYLVGVLAARGMAEVQAEELTVLPGTEEVVALLEVQRWASSGQFDCIVVDCAPSGDTLRLLALPETIGFYAARLRGTPGRLLRTLAASLTGAGAAVPGAEVRDAVGDLLDNLAAARTLLTDARQSSFRLVLTPERVVIAEGRRMYTALTLHGYPMDGVVVNRVLPDSAEGDFLSEWRAAQQLAMHGIEESFGELPLHRVPMTGAEPVGVTALTNLALTVFGGADPMAGSARSAAFAVAASPQGYQLTLPLPGVDRAAVELARSGDDLVVTVGPLRRRITLPSVCRRCRTGGARFEGDDLIVDFHPDVAQWPQALVGAAQAMAVGR